MSKLNRILLLFLCIVILPLPGLSQITHAEEDTNISEKLTALGVTSVTADLKSAMRRKDVVPILVEYLGLETAKGNKQTTPFSDVLPTDPEIGAYQILQSAGVISGKEKGRFYPEEFLTYNDAITMVINAIGYRQFAERNGGYPQGYLYAANKCGMLKNLEGNGNDAIIYQDFYRLLEASLDAPAMVTDGIIGDDLSFHLSDSVTVAEEHFGIHIITGIVTGTENTRLKTANSSKIGKYDIEIDDVIYKTHEQTFSAFLGKNVKAYLKTDSEDDSYVLYLEEKQNKTVSFNARDLADTPISDDKLCYYNSNGEKDSVRLNTKNLCVIQNQSAVFAWENLNELIPKSGTIRGIDNDADGKIDVLFLESYRNVVVGSVDLYSGTIYDKFLNESIKVDENRDELRIYDETGATISLSAIARDDLICVMQSEQKSDYTITEIYKKNETVSGTLSEITQDGFYVVDDVRYRIAENVDSYIKQKKIAPLSVGTDIKLYLDQNGEIGYFVYSNTTQKALYGFVAGVDLSGFSESVPSFKIYTQNNEWITAETTQNVIVDGKRMKISKREEAQKVISAAPAGDIILFTLQNGKITKIDTKRRNEGADDKIQDAGNLNLIASGTTFNSRYGVCHDSQDASSSAFIVPQTGCFIFSTPESDKLLDDLENYSVKQKLDKYYFGPSISGGSVYGQKIESYAAYNLENKEINTATCLLLRGTTASAAKTLGRESAFCVISSITDAIDQDGDVAKNIYYYQNGQKTNALVCDKVIYSHERLTTARPESVLFSSLGLSSGDVIQIGMDVNGKISDINVVWRENPGTVTDAWLKTPSYDMTFDLHDGEGGAVGYITSVDIQSGAIAYNVPDTAGNDRYYITLANEAKLSVYRSERKKAESITISELIQGDMVILHSTDGFDAKASQIIVIR